MDSESSNWRSNSEQESESNIGENDNNSSNLNNYRGGNEFYHEESLRTGENSCLSINNSFSNNIVGNCDEDMNSCCLSSKKHRENDDTENFYIDEEEKVESLFINNKEDILSFQKFENNEIIKEDKKENDNEAKEKIESSENKENVKLKEDENKIVFKISKTAREQKNKSVQYGRKKQKEKDQGNNGLHTRDSEDNKIRKIKSYFGKGIYFFINRSFKKKKDNFLKLEISINRRLEKKFNEELFKMKLKDIYFKYKISEKYIHFDKDANQKLINEIYEEQEETEVIKILDLTYLEAFKIFRRKIKDIEPELKNKIDGTDILNNKKFKDFDCFIEKIREEEKNNNGDIEEYINDIKHLCLYFEEWFGKKVGRINYKKAKK